MPHAAPSPCRHRGRSHDSPCGPGPCRPPGHCGPDRTGFPCATAAPHHCVPPPPPPPGALQLPRQSESLPGAMSALAGGQRWTCQDERTSRAALQQTGSAGSRGIHAPKRGGTKHPCARFPAGGAETASDLLWRGEGRHSKERLEQAPSPARRPAPRLRPRWRTFRDPAGCRRLGDPGPATGPSRPPCRRSAPRCHWWWRPCRGPGARH